MIPLPITDADLAAYADGQLAPARAPDVEAALARDPALAARVAALRAQSADLRDAFDPWLDETIPARLAAAAAGTAKVSGSRRPWVRQALAAAAVLVVGVGIGWMAREVTLENAGTPTSFTRAAALSHALYANDINRPVEIWAAEEKRLANWLTKRLGFAVQAPDLNSLHFALVGGRLVAGNESPTGMFVYENPDRQRLTLQVRKRGTAGGETAFRYAVEDGVGVYYWIDDGVSYALSGQLDRAQLLAIGRVVYGQLAAFEAARK